MPSKKQRRRQQKLRRHEYEEVWVDAEGNEVAPDDVELLDGTVSQNGAGRRESGGKQERPVRTSSGKVVQPPSWTRVAKRGVFFAPIMFLLITFLPGSDGYGAAQKVFLTVQYVVLLILFMYMTERFTYRLTQKRQANAPTKKS